MFAIMHLYMHFYDNDYELIKEVWLFILTELTRKLFIRATNKIKIFSQVTRNSVLGV